MIKVSLRNNQLTGNIPSQIFTISSLQTLNLFDNNLNGTIPNEIAKENSLQSCKSKSLLNLLCINVSLTCYFSYSNFIKQPNIRVHSTRTIKLYAVEIPSFI